MKHFLYGIPAFLLLILSVRTQGAELSPGVGGPEPDPAFIGDGKEIVAEPFDLADVRLLDGLFKTYQDLDGKYLLSLDPERLLHNFRVNAMLPSTAQPLGGWEAPNYGLRGHFVGHYLSACAELYAATGDKRYVDRGTYLVTELAKCQDALGGGYPSAFPASIFDKLEAHAGKVPAPYYTVHKIMAGLLDQYHYCGNQQALEMTIKMADYFEARMAKLSPEAIEICLNTAGPGQRYEYGGMSEVLHNLYVITKKPEYLTFADVFDRGTFLNPLAASQDKLSGLHANTHIPQVVGIARHFELTGDDRYRRAADYFWSQVTKHHSYVTGGDSMGELFEAIDKEGNALRADSAETCNVYNMLKLTQHVFSWKPDAQTADYYEQALYNHILVSIDPDTGMTTYYLSLQPGHFKIYSTPYDSFWCCTGTGAENQAKYGGAIYYHHADTLWVNLFIPSRLTWREKGLTLTQNTSFPQSDSTSLTVQAAQPTQAKILLRVPYWTTGASVKINGQDQSTDQPANGYLVIDRTWRNGDKLDYAVPMKLHLHRANDNPNKVAVMYGPVVLAGDLGAEGLPPTDLVSDHRGLFKVPNPAVPSLTGSGSDLNSWIKPVSGQPLNFTTARAGQPNDVTLKPFYDIHHQRYTVYWTFTDTTPKANYRAFPNSFRLAFSLLKEHVNLFGNAQ